VERRCRIANKINRSGSLWQKMAPAVAVSAFPEILHQLDNPNAKLRDNISI